MIQIKNLDHSDIDKIVEAFARHNWPKPRETFENYLSDQEKDDRFCWVIYQENDVAGYVTLNLNSKYQSFAKESIPEIQDLNILPPYRSKGLGTALLDVAERKATEFSRIVGIGVGLYADYGAAQRLYVKRGYIPDGKGITYKETSVPPGEHIRLDDDLVLWFMKKL